MPFVLLIVGLTMLFASINNTQKKLFSLVQGDFTGQGSFIYWLAAIAVIGGVGYVPQMRGLSHAFLALILVVLVLNVSKNNPQEFFGKITNALANSSQGTPANSNLPALPELPNIPFSATVK
jgi:hypothetical protein